jgi:DNA-binding NarL/FixJ family response regulator
MSGMEPTEVRRILIVDDHPLFLDALKELINREPGWQVCGKAADANEAMRLVSETNPDLVIIDITLDGSNGIDLVKNLSAKYPDLAMLVLSMHDESLYSERAIRAGAMGYVTKHEPPKTVKAAIQHVLSGELYLSHRMATSLVSKLMRGSADAPRETPIQKLSDRELEVFRLLGQGRGARQIAQDLDLSIATINSFRARIKEKLHLKTSTELLLQANKWVREQTEQGAPSAS